MPVHKARARVGCSSGPTRGEGRPGGVSTHEDTSVMLNRMRFPGVLALLAALGSLTDCEREQYMKVRQLPPVHICNTQGCLTRLLGRGAPRLHDAKPRFLSPTDGLVHAISCLSILCGSDYCAERQAGDEMESGHVTLVRLIRPDPTAGAWWDPLGLTPKSIFALNGGDFLPTGITQFCINISFMASFQEAFLPRGEIIPGAYSLELVSLSRKELAVAKANAVPGEPAWTHVVNKPTTVWDRRYYHACV